MEMAKKIMANKYRDDVNLTAIWFINYIDECGLKYLPGFVVVSNSLANKSAVFNFFSIL